MAKDEKVALRVPGQEIPDAGLPSILSAGTRSAASSDHEFLPAGLVQVVRAYDLSRASRAASIAGPRQDEVDSEHVLAIELEDGVTVFVRADKLRQDLAHADPEALSGDAVDLERLGHKSRTQRGLFTDLVRRVTVLAVGTDAITEAAKRKAAALLAKPVERLVGRLGAKALMWAIESKLAGGGGLFRWEDSGELKTVASGELEQAAREGPMLLFIHGTGSNTRGGLGALQSTGSQEDWKKLREKYGSRIYGFEHPTLSVSPIENALELARLLPPNARLSLVTHSRGGLVGDLLALGEIDPKIIESYQRRAAAESQLDEQERVLADTEDKAALRDLSAILKTRQFRIERYVRVASPSRGTRLASANLDLFLSGLLSLMRTAPFLAASPTFAAFKRAILEIVKNRFRPDVVPGIEAMLPESPIGEFLQKAKPQLQGLAVIAGDTQRSGFFKRLGMLLTDHLIFDGLDNDLVVDTDSMYAGLARPGVSGVRFERDPEVTHFHYFSNRSSREALCEWLTAAETASVQAFSRLGAAAPEPSPTQVREAMEAEGSRGLMTPNLPVVVVLPGIMGSHLGVNSKRIWLDPLQIGIGKIQDLVFGAKNISAESLFELFYGNLCQHLALTHRVVRFPYDWRLPLPELGDSLASGLKKLLDETEQAKIPVRILAHSMGGLVTRAMAAQNRELWDRLMQRDGARFIMLGTPNQGSHAMVETLIGKGDSIRKLARLVDQKNSLQTWLDIVGEFRGALQLLPAPGFPDTGGEQAGDYFTPDIWRDYKNKVKDWWFGDHIAGTPTAAALNDARNGWALLEKPDARNAMERHSKKIVYVFGKAPNTPCGVREQEGALKMLGTPKGDGTVTWASGRIGGIGTFYSMQASHGDLANTREYFRNIQDLLAKGESNLPKDAPQLRGAETDEVVSYDAGPVPYPTWEEASLSLLGARQRDPVVERATPALKISCTAGDLRWANKPVLVGHYEGDPVAGPEKVLDELLHGNLELRRQLGLYAAGVGTATIVLLPQTESEKLLGHRPGALVAGLGEYGKLSVAMLEDAVASAASRFLLQALEQKPPTGGKLQQFSVASVLLGYNSTTNITIPDSLMAIARGVLRANRQFALEKQNVSISEIEIFELYVDTAITIAHELGSIAERLNTASASFGMKVEASGSLRELDSCRPRLRAMRNPGYWPRLIIEDAESSTKQSSGSAAPAERFAANIKFTYLGERARAEVTDEQRQPGLVEGLVEQSIRDSRHREDFARTLFQLLVPHELKEAARQQDRIWLLVDPMTGNLPWEMIQDPEGPLAVRMRMVRQLASAQFRVQVRQATGRRALVIGNPSTEGFNQVFEDRPDRPLVKLAPLPGAETEAKIVVETLRQQGYVVESAIGQQEKALDVFNKLLDQQSYRIVHIAAHGLVEGKARDGRARTGVVLSAGLLITACEIRAMNIVPELVFLNCCHLGSVNSGSNRLAASVSRELISIGVKAVVAAGWAVDDAAGARFAEVFYNAMTARRAQFGDALYEARNAAYREFPGTNTFGAYQAYGDPAFVLGPGEREESTGWAGGPWVSINEVLDEFARERVSLSRRREAEAPVDVGATARKVDSILEKIPSAWKETSCLQAELGRLYGDLGSAYFPQAQEHYLAAIQADDGDLRVPLLAVEQLANLEARQGEKEKSLELIDRAIQRLNSLADALQSTGKTKVNGERCALLGSAYKRRAVLLSREEPPDRAAISDALQKSIDAYRKGQQADPDRPNPYHLQNFLSLQAVLQTGRSDADIALARQSGEQARAAYQSKGGIWNAIQSVDALFVEALLDGRLEGAKSQQATRTLAENYRALMTTVHATEREIDSVLAQLRLLERLFRIHDRSAVGDRLNQLRMLIAPTEDDKREPTRTQAEKPASKSPAKSSKRESGLKETSSRRKRSR